MGGMASCARGGGAGSVVHPVNSDELPHSQQFNGHAAMFQSQIREPTPNLVRLLRLDLLKGPGSNSTGPGLASHTSSSNGSSAENISPESGIKVALLVRPTLAHEHTEPVVRVSAPTQLTINAASSSSTGATAEQESNFTFDSVHHVQSTRDSKTLFAAHGIPLVERFLSGYNACIMAYGQTGSGKTHSMGLGKPLSTALNPSAPGAQAILPSVTRAVWEYVKHASSSYEISIKVQMIEIINETVQDLLRSFTPATGQLLVPGASNAKVEVRETGPGQVVIEGAAVVAVHGMQGLAECVDHGMSGRATASHKMNDASSRSHALLVLTMEQKAKPDAMRKLPRELHCVRSRLSLVDLAGSERVKQTGAEGARFTEGVSINSSLLTLGKCINAIVEGQKHVPYRESKLTRVLQDSLGGTAETLMLACVSPVAANLEQTLNTVRYAQRARKVQNHLKLQTLSLAEEVAHLRALVELLQQDNAMLQQQIQQGAQVHVG